MNAAFLDMEQWRFSVLSGLLLCPVLFYFYLNGGQGRLRLSERNGLPCMSGNLRTLSGSILGACGLRMLAMLLLLSLMASVCLHLILQLALPDIKPDSALQVSSPAVLATEPGNALLIFFATVVLLPLVEELLFRGLLYRFLRARLPVAAAIAISAFCFGFWHDGLSQRIFACTMGLLFAFSYEQVWSLAAVYLMHSVSNALDFVLLLTGGVALSERQSVILIILSAAGFAWLRRYTCMR